ncbi:MAG: hypothetical protein Q8P20_05035 [bacterium]|nr:hypothetical protein [bacterium]
MTRGDVYSDPNPPMTNLAMMKISTMRNHLPADLTKISIICGDSRRHKDMLAALNINPEKTTFTSIIGGTEILKITDDTKTADHDKIVETVKKLINELGTPTFICAGTSFLINLGVKSPEQSAIYRITGSEIEKIDDSNL